MINLLNGMAAPFQGLCATLSSNHASSQSLRALPDSVRCDALSLIAPYVLTDFIKKLRHLTTAEVNLSSVVSSFPMTTHSSRA